MSARSAFTALSLCCAAFSTCTLASNADAWSVTGGIYAYLPTISGTSAFSVPPNTGGGEASVDIDQLLDNLNGVFMGSLDVRKGEWGGFTDLLYMDVGGTKSQTRALTIGPAGLPADATANADYSLKGTVWTLAAYFHTEARPELNVDLVMGARMLDLDQSLGWALAGNVASVPVLDRAGNRAAGIKSWDAILGAKGRYAFGEGRRWFIPFYVDVGGGDADLTWQAMTGLGYSFAWGDVVASWRYLDYQFTEGKALRSLTFGGPAFAAVFHW
ncbi:hypothetical protein GCM10025771_12980 [Niveibacterium umoris]|uniref:Outer membrane protein beta-barrel domain-containing protein n=1 Tax=Niveibacterium umoris TaxID=1193620 RepID=A0A840BQQ3_9RHOO|nr:hypothetical protein [Niveibacterium umoris]MBB4013146.1 hypothetical protein [Niveibacterium umoris]